MHQDIDFFLSVDSRQTRVLCQTFWQVSGQEKQRQCLRKRHLVSHGIAIEDRTSNSDIPSRSHYLGIITLRYHGYLQRPQMNSPEPDTATAVAVGAEEDPEAGAGVSRQPEQFQVLMASRLPWKSVSVSFICLQLRKPHSIAFIFPDCVSKSASHTSHYKHKYHNCMSAVGMARVCPVTGV
jgi:hypothetical protein